jgi:YD repeat-containing protein
VVSEIRTPQHVTTRVINSDGTVASESQAGRTTSFSYDALGRLSIEQPPGNVAPTATTYDPAGHWVRVTRGSTFTQTTLDGFGRPIGTIDAAGARTTTVYDALGRVVEQGLPFEPGVGAGDVRELVSYDALGRVVARTHPGGSGAAVWFAYGPGTVTITDENNHATTQTWQAFGNPDAGRLVGVTDATQHSWTYTYDALDHLLSVAAPDGTQRQWTYTPLNRLATEVHPESGTVTYAYDGDGRLQQKTDARGTVFAYTYDTNNRVTSITARNRVTQFGYEPGSDNTQWASVGYKDPQNYIVGAIETRYLYDAAGRLQTRQDLIDGRTFTSVYTFDELDNVTTLTYPYLDVSTRRQIGFGYDANSQQLASVVDRGSNLTYATNFVYHPSGMLERYEAGNGIVTTITRDPNRYQITSITAGALSLGYTEYDPAGNVKTLTDNRPGFTQSFTYDALDHLLTATGPYGAHTFNYDVHGNRTTVPGVATYEYDASTLRLVSQNGIPFGYDANGNLISEPLRTYNYTPDNQLETVVINGVPTSYQYDAFGSRIATITGGVTTYSLRAPGGRLLTEWTSPGVAGQTRDYVYADERLISAVSTTITTAGLPSGVLTVGGAVATVALPTGQDARYTFVGTGGQTVQARMVGTSSFACNWTLAILSPTGSSLGSDTPCSGTLASVTATLPASGVYTVLVHPTGTSSGTVTLSVSSTGVGAPVITSVSPWIGTVGTSVTISGSGLTPFNAVQFNSARAAASGSATTLTTTVPVGAASGRVTVVTPFGTASGPVDFFVPPAPYTAANVSVTGRLSSGVPLAMSISGSGSIGLGVIDLEAGQRFLVVSLAPAQQNNFQVIRPDGVVLWTGWMNSVFPLELTAPSTGTYTIVNPYVGAGSYTLSVKVSPPDRTGVLPLNGTPTSVTMAAGQNARESFHANAGQRTQVVIDATLGGSPGLFITLQAPDGSVVQSGSIYVAGETGSVTTLPLTGTYSWLLNPWYGNEGTVTLRVYDVPPDPVTSTAIDNPDVTAVVAAPFQKAFVEFPGAVNQRIFVTASGSTFTGSCPVRIDLFAPSGTRLDYNACANSSTFFDARVLTEAGTYRIAVDGNGTATGQIVVRVRSVPSDLTGSVTVGGDPVTANLSVAGQNGSFTFTGTSGQKIAVQATGGTFATACQLYLRILKPDNSTLVSDSCMGTTGFVDATTLPTTGTYTVFLNPQGTATGSATFRLFDASDVTGTLTAGAPTTITTNIGQNATYTFNGAANDKLSLVVASGTYGASCNSYLRIFKPDGSVLVSWTCVGVSAFVDTTVLPVSGMYSAVFDPGGTATGSSTVTRYLVPPDTASSAAVNDPAVTLTTTVPGQNAVLTFTGAASQVVTVRLSNNTIGSVSVRLETATGTLLTSASSSSSSFNLPQVTLPSTPGTYTVRINPSGAVIGSVGVQVTNP